MTNDTYIIVDILFNSSKLRFNVLESLLAEDQIDTLRLAEYDVVDISDHQRDDLLKLIEYLKSLNCEAGIKYDIKLDANIYVRPKNVKSMYAINFW